MPKHKVAEGVLSDFYVVRQRVGDPMCYDSNPDCPLSVVSHAVRLFGRC